MISVSSACRPAGLYIFLRNFDFVYKIVCSAYPYNVIDLPYILYMGDFACLKRSNIES